MRHKIVQIILFLTTVAPSTIFAQSRPFKPMSETLTQKAALTYAKVDLGLSNPKVDHIISYPNGKLPTLRIYNFKGGGWVLMSTNRGTRAVLAFSDKHSFQKNRESKWFLKGYSKYVADASSRTTHSSWRALLPVNPSLSYTATVIYEQYGPYADHILWNQKQFFNDTISQRLNDPADNTAAGCVAVATGMALKYHGLPYLGTGTSTHTHNGVTYTTNHDFPHMLDSASLGTSDPDYQGETARFLYDMGVGLKINWGPSTGGSVVNAIPLYRDHYYTDVDTMVYLSECPSTTAWLNLLKNELKNKRPTVYVGSNSSSAHAWLNDGIRVQSEGTFLHFNLGWGGSANGWYTLESMPNNYTSGNRALVGIQPRKPDLTGGIALKGHVYETGSTQFTLTSKNIGQSPSGKTNFEVYASFNNQLDTVDTLIYTGSLQSLSISQQISLYGSFKLPSAFHDKEFYLIAKTDAYDRLKEGNKSNNVSATFISNIDYVPYNVSMPKLNYSPGDDVELKFEVKNTGSTNVYDSTIAKVYLSKTRNYNSSAQLLEIVDVPPLYANATSGKIEVEFTLESDLTPGSYYVHYRVDAGYEVSERSESNNTASTLLRVSHRGGFKTEDYTSTEPNSVEGNNLKVYPNPVQGDLTIDVGDLSGTLTVRDLTGRILNKSKVEGNLQLNTDLLDNGTYLISFISTSGTLYYNTFIKQ